MEFRIQDRNPTASSSSVATLPAFTSGKARTPSFSSETKSPRTAAPLLLGLSPQRDQKIVTLQFGERRFTTTIGTLRGRSTFFDSSFSGRWSLQQEPDGSYFLDWDGDIFARVLRYLRNRVFPLFYTRANGFDYALYIVVLQLTDYLGISKLVDWINDKRYLHAITLIRQSDANSAEGETRADVRTVHYPQWQARKVYTCPRGFHQHRGDKEKCGKDCTKARGDAADVCEDELVWVRVWGVHEESVFNSKVCLEGEEESSGR